MKKEHLEMILEDINGKFDLVLEGQDSLHRELYGVRDELSEKIDQNTFAIKVLNQKIDSVSNNLDAHRQDTEVHRGYQVREE
jgi:outer membrane murein-binding lipoprotein Lpp